jgi:rhodanese-related sulfurtransferase
MSKEDFIRLVTADQPEAPPYFTYDAVLNSKERRTLDDVLARQLNALPLERVLELGDNGAQLLDTREPAEFASSHLAGSINIGLSGQYATWAGTVLDRSRPIVIIANPGREDESAVRLGRIGFDNIAGYLKDGLRSLAERPDLERSTERLSAPLAAERVAGAHPPFVIDVRTPREREQKYVEGSSGIPLNHLAENLNRLPRDRPILLYCAAIVRRLARAFCRQTALIASAKLPAGLPLGRLPTCQCAKRLRRPEVFSRRIDAVDPIALRAAIHSL